MERFCNDLLCYYVFIIMIPVNRNYVFIAMLFVTDKELEVLKNNLIELNFL